MACSNPSMMRAPTAGRFFATRAAFFSRVFVFVTPASYFFAAYTATRSGTRRFMVLRSALLKFAFSFFA
jgi:hypothetical protein